jgi:hypothetical protein
LKLSGLSAFEIVGRQASSPCPGTSFMPYDRRPPLTLLIVL